MAGPTFEQRLEWIENCINKLLQECQSMVDMNTAENYVDKSDEEIEALHSSVVALESVVQRLKSKVEKIEKENS